MSSTKLAHEKIVQLKLADTQMRENVSTAMHTLQNNRGKVIESKFDDWEGLRDKARQAKDNALMSLDERLVEFEKNATKNGMQVHWASSDTDACEIIYQLMVEKMWAKSSKASQWLARKSGLITTWRLRA